MAEGRHRGGASPPETLEARRKAFGAALAKRRKELALTQSALAQALGGVGQSAVSQWERGETQPKSPHVYATEKVLGLTPGMLSKFLGYLPPPGRASSPEAGGVKEAIRRDPLLRPAEKRSLLALYEALVAGRDPRGEG